MISKSARSDRYNDPNLNCTSNASLGWLILLECAYLNKYLREWKLTFRSARSGGIAYPEELDWLVRLTTIFVTTTRFAIHPMPANVTPSNLINYSRIYPIVSCGPPQEGCKTVPCSNFPFETRSQHKSIICCTIQWIEWTITLHGRPLCSERQNASKISYKIDWLIWSILFHCTYVHPVLHKKQWSIEVHVEDAEIGKGSQETRKHPSRMCINRLLTISRSIPCISGGGVSAHPQMQTTPWMQTP